MSIVAVQPENIHAMIGLRVKCRNGITIRIGGVGFRVDRWSKIAR